MRYSPVGQNFRLFIAANLLLLVSCAGEEASPEIQLLNSFSTSVDTLYVPDNILTG
ncbi:MAG: hypothetical protein WD037_04685 [Balneolales bacterium]